MADREDPRLRSTMTVVYLLDSAPDWDRLVAAHEWASRLIPRIRQRVVEPPLGLGAPTWVADDEFDLGFHVRRLRLPQPGTLRQLLDLVQGDAMASFDRSRPPWRASLVEGLEDGRTAYVLKLHHSMTDGQGGTQLVGLLHSRTREPSPDKPLPDPPAPENASPVAILAEQATGALGSAPGRRAPRRHRDRQHRAPDAPAAHRGSRGRRAFRTLPAAHPGPAAGGSRRRCSPRSRSWRFDAWRSRSRAQSGGQGRRRLAERRLCVGAAWRLSPLPRALRPSHRGDGDGDADQPARGDHPMGGNRSPGRVSRRRSASRTRRSASALVHEFVLTARDEPALDVFGLLAPALNRLPMALVARGYGAQTTKLDLQASNVAGLPYDAYIAGAKIEQMLPFGPLPGCAVMATLLSYAGTCCIGLNTDPGRGDRARRVRALPRGGAGGSARPRARPDGNGAARPQPAGRRLDDLSERSRRLRARATARAAAVSPASRSSVASKRRADLGDVLVDPRPASRSVGSARSTATCSVPGMHDASPRHISSPALRMTIGTSGTPACMATWNAPFLNGPQPRRRRAGALGRDGERDPVAQLVDGRLRAPRGPARSCARSMKATSASAPIGAKRGVARRLLLRHAGEVAAQELAEDDHVERALVVEDEHRRAVRPEVLLAGDVDVDPGERRGRARSRAPPPRLTAVRRLRFSRPTPAPSPAAAPQPASAAPVRAIGRRPRPARGGRSGVTGQPRSRRDARPGRLGVERARVADRLEERDVLVAVAVAEAALAGRCRCSAANSRTACALPSPHRTGPSSRPVNSAVLDLDLRAEDVVDAAARAPAARPGSGWPTRRATTVWPSRWWASTSSQASG